PYEIIHSPLPPISKQMNNYNYASRTKRLLNWIIDSLIISIIWFLLFISASKIVIALGLLDLIEEGKTYDLNYTILPVLFLYYLILEGSFKTTIGKLITRTKLVQVNGENIHFFNVLIRTICRLIPFDPLSYLKDNPVGWHDSLSKTRLLNKKTKR
ncbi:MAG: RDD family protein, partial [Chlorobi bacterium]|nr:RDD family protein [Chlorobiota bacterium]